MRGARLGPSVVRSSRVSCGRHRAGADVPFSFHHIILYSKCDRIHLTPQNSLLYYEQLLPWDVGPMVKVVDSAKKLTATYIYVRETRQYSEKNIIIPRFHDNCSTQLSNSIVNLR